VARSTCSSSGEADENQPAMTDARGVGGWLEGWGVER
jgi:hypothetical protein